LREIYYVEVHLDRGRNPMGQEKREQENWRQAASLRKNRRHRNLSIGDLAFHTCMKVQVTMNEAAVWSYHESLLVSAV
jgi:hypothetical protein